jgi:pyruvate/2-oxoglutarate dehydrogenase complex dihydrolipoamide acyltransferase (E2) component
VTTEIRVPQLPESVADATLVAWHKQPGETVKRDENLADLETDKVVLEVPAPVNGVIRELRVTSGTSVTSGQVLAILEEGGAATAAPAPKAAAPAAKPAEANGGDGKLSPWIALRPCVARCAGAAASSRRAVRLAHPRGAAPTVWPSPVPVRMPALRTRAPAWISCRDNRPRPTS